eukprot:scaffold8648_cov126-Isochrysis_galbana.AAC.5
MVPVESSSPDWQSSRTPAYSRKAADTVTRPWHSELGSQHAGGSHSNFRLTRLPVRQCCTGRPFGKEMAGRRRSRPRHTRVWARAPLVLRSSDWLTPIAQRPTRCLGAMTAKRLGLHEAASELFRHWTAREPKWTMGPAQRCHRWAGARGWLSC